MSRDLVEIVRDIYRQAISRVLPETVIADAVNLGHTGILEIQGRTFPVNDRPICVIALGKAAVEMTVAVEAILGERLHSGIVITKSWNADRNLRSSVLLGSHPVPDERSLRAGEAAIQFAEAIPQDALVLCLISGGGSALLESLRPGVTLTDLQQTTRALLNAGASIHELNAVRARMSQIKAGGLLARLGHVEVVNLVISDVLGDDLSTIASGPTVPRDQSESAEAILKRYGVDCAIPEVASSLPQAEPATLVLSNLSRAIDGACGAARAHEMEPIVLSRSLTGEARSVAATLAAVVADTRMGLTSLPRPSCILAGGETTVAVRGDGAGGRNTEGALAAALRLRGVDGVAIGFLATDGDDGETNVAGGIVTGDTVTDENLQRALQALERNDSFTFLEDVGAAWGIGATGTNVNDLVIGVIG